MATQALELDETLGEAHALLGKVKQDRSDWEGAEKEYQLATQLAPHSYQAFSEYASLMSSVGRHDEAVSLGERAEELDPHNLTAKSAVGGHLRQARRYDEALEQLQIVLNIDPEFPDTYPHLISTYEAMDAYPEAAAAWQKYEVLSGASPDPIAGLADAAASGKEDYWRWKLDYEKERDASPVLLAEMYGALGETDEAFEWLEKMRREQDGGLNFLKTQPRWDPLRADPRFEDLLQELGVEP